MGKVICLKTRYFVWPENPDTMEAIAGHFIDTNRPITKDKINSYRDWKNHELTLIEIEEPDMEYFKEMKSGCKLKFRLFKQEPGKPIREISFFTPKKSPRRARPGTKRPAREMTGHS